MPYISEKTPPAAQLEAGKKLVDCAVGLKEISEDFKLLGARSVRATESPGMALFNKIRSWRGFTEKP